MGEKKGTKFTHFDPNKPGASQSTGSTRPRRSQAEEGIQSNAGQSRQSEEARQPPRAYSQGSVGQQIGSASSSRGGRQPGGTPRFREATQGQRDAPSSQGGSHFGRGGFQHKNQRREQYNRPNNNRKKENWRQPKTDAREQPARSGGFSELSSRHYGKETQQHEVGRTQEQEKPVPVRGPPQKFEETPREQPESLPQKDKSRESTPRPFPAASTSSAATLPTSTSKSESKFSDDSQLVSTTPIIPGTKGDPIAILSNHLELCLGSLKEAYHYAVTIHPEKTSKKLCRLIVEAFRLKHFSNRYPAFDGRTNIYASTPLSGNLDDVISDHIVLPAKNGRQETFNIAIKWVNMVDLTPLREALKYKTTPLEALQCVDVVLRSAPAVRFMTVGRSFFTKPEMMLNLEQGTEMYNGFFQSTIRGSKALLNVDVIHKAFLKAVPVIDALVDVLTQYPDKPFPREALSKELLGWQVKIFEEFLARLKITYQIPNQPASKRVYQVNELAGPANRARFTHEGRNITVEEYFQKEKKCRLRYPDLPTVWVGNKDRKILLPMELCVINEGQPANRLGPKQTSNMIKHAATSTEERKKKIMGNVHLSGYNNNPCVQEFGFSVGNEFQKLDARVLHPPKLRYANEKNPVTPFKGKWTNSKFLNGVTINKWTIAAATRYPPNKGELANMAKMLKQHAVGCGMVFETNAEEPFTTIGENFKDIERYFEGKKQKNFDVIFVVVPNYGPQYSYVKSAAELNVGCLTQCVQMGTLKKNKMNVQTVVNILLKVNSKLNGTNHCFAQKPKIMEKPIMIMGADVTHPGPQSKTIPSVAAVTASHDPDAFQYNICWRLQRPKQEIIEDLENIVVEQLKFYDQKNKCKPEVIIFFRDGVGEGHFDQVIDEEVKAIKAACRRSQAGYEPKITFLVVQKRHHTRFFPVNPEKVSYDKDHNVPAGTCVDTTITHPFMQDFYLVSHASIRGVARPTKYCTLVDENDVDNDQIQQLTYYLCHMFTRCNRSVSYPAPTYYAHLAAARGKVYIANRKLNLEKLEDETKNYQIKTEIQKGLPMFFV